MINVRREYVVLGLPGIAQEQETSAMVECAMIPLISVKASPWPMVLPVMMDYGVQKLMNALAACAVGQPATVQV
jgi:hypothetical protein